MSFVCVISHRGFTSRNDRDDLHHAGMHVEEQVAVEGPVSDMVCRDVERELLGRFDDDRMLARLERTFIDDEIEEHPVQVDRVGHHGVIDERDTQPLTFVEDDRAFDGAELYAVE